MRKRNRASKRVLATRRKSRHRDRVMVASGRRIIRGPSGSFAPMISYQAGDRCPECTRGRLYRSRPLVRLRFTGQPLANVTHYELEQLRCGACGALFVAHMPPEAGQETYDLSLKVNLAVAHYHLGLPFKRIESFQQLVGMPLPDATQWELVEQVADSTYPLYEYLKRLGAQQPLVYQDDTGARILSLIKENQADPPPERKGMYTTVLRFEGEHAICLYFTGRQHAGENLDDLLAHRDPQSPAHPMDVRWPGGQYPQGTQGPGGGLELPGPWAPAVRRYRRVLPRPNAHG